MSVLERRIELLKEQNRRLAGLLADAHPGLFTWCQALIRVTNEIQAVMDGKRDE